jgi:hypothetical protein
MVRGGGRSAEMVVGEERKNPGLFIWLPLVPTCPLALGRYAEPTRSLCMLQFWLPRVTHGMAKAAGLINSCNAISFLKQNK